MALILEEEKKSSNLTIFIIGFLIILFLIFLTYYIFFLKPELVELVINKDNILTDLSQIQINPEEIINSNFYNNLKSYNQHEELQESPGRVNPFEPF